jgi:xanthine/uracil permease
LSIGSQLAFPIRDPTLFARGYLAGGFGMQMSSGNLNESDRQVYRRWSVAFGIVYGIIALVFAGLIASQPPIAADWFRSKA